MKTKSKTMIMLIILTIILVNITTIAAYEHTNDTNTLKDNPQQIIKTTTKNIKTDTTSVTGYQELYDTIEEAKTTSTTRTINLEEGNYNITNPIEIKGKNGPVTITINGQNNTINGQSINKFITVAKSNTLLINNLTITDTNSTAGSAINSKGIVNITNIHFKNSYSESWISNCGGAIYNSGTMNIKDSTFINNTIVTDTFGGGAIFNNGILTVENTTFNENNALKGSALFSLKSHTNMTKCNFTQNNANNTATVYNFNSTVNIKNCIFNNNTALDSSIVETIDNAYTHLENITVIDNLNSKYLIKNLANTMISQCNLSDNNVLSDMIENLDTMKIIESTLTCNNASNLIKNQASLTLDNNNITHNNVSNYIIENDIEYDSSTSSINNTNFNNNNAKSILYNLNSTMIVYDSTFINNTSEELFNGTPDTFKIVSNNVYIGNNLSSQIESENNVVFNYDENIILEAFIKTKAIYNTTINAGKVFVYDEDKQIGSFNVTGGKCNITLTENITDEKTYTLGYSDNPNYRNNTTKVHVKTVHPEYEIVIQSSDDFASYNESLNFTIHVKNIGEGNASNIYIENIIPENVEIIQISDEYYDNTTNRWFIERLDSMDECILNMSLKITSYDNFNISIEIPGNNQPVTYNKTVEVLKPEISLELDYDTDDMILHENYTINISVKNTGKGLSTNTLIYIRDDENNVDMIESGIIEANSSKKIQINKTAGHVGLNQLNISFKESLTNQTSNYTISYNVGEVSIQVENVRAYHGDTVNLTATVGNISYLTKNVKYIFKINGLSVKNHTITVTDNKLILENYVIPTTWSKENYTLEVKVLDKGFKKTIHNKSMIRIDRKNVISIVENIRALPGEVINLTARFYDTDGKAVCYGYAKFKLNGKTIDKVVTVEDGLAWLSYKIPDKLRSKNYTISTVFGKNRMYYSNRNSSKLLLESQECEINITNSTYSKGNDYNINATIYGTKNRLNAYSGKVIFKLNDVTYTDIINVKGSFINCTIDNPTVKNVNNITMCYSGNNVLKGARKTITFINDTSMNLDITEKRMKTIT